MIAAPRLLLSERPTELPQWAGLGDRFHYFRGQSGRRYIFTAIAADDLADFTDTVVVTATREGDGRLSVRGISVFDHDMRGAADIATRVASQTVLVHLLAETPAERRAIAEDLAGTPMAMAA